MEPVSRLHRLPDQIRHILHKGEQTSGLHCAQTPYAGHAITSFGVSVSRHVSSRNSISFDDSSFHILLMASSLESSNNDNVQNPYHLPDSYNCEATDDIQSNAFPTWT
jgi:hypothetical protein